MPPPTMADHGGPARVGFQKMQHLRQQHRRHLRDHPETRALQRVGAGGPHAFVLLVVDIFRRPGKQLAEAAGAGQQDRQRSRHRAGAEGAGRDDGPDQRIDPPDEIEDPPQPRRRRERPSARSRTWPGSRRHAATSDRSRNHAPWRRCRACRGPAFRPTARRPGPAKVSTLLRVWARRPAPVVMLMPVGDPLIQSGRGSGASGTSRLPWGGW